METRRQISTSVPTEKTTAPVEEEEQPKGLTIGPRLSFLLCVVAIGISGFVSLTLTNPDQGKLVTMAEMEQRIVAEIQRIKNDPNMPTQAKEFALGALQRGRFVGQYMRNQQKGAPSP
jgi:hypothetical protein